MKKLVFIPGGGYYALSRLSKGVGGGARSTPDNASAVDAEDANLII